VIHEGRKKPIRFVSFGLGEGHAAHEALGEQHTPDPRPYAWYVRVPDLMAKRRLLHEERGRADPAEHPLPAAPVTGDPAGLRRGSRSIDPASFCCWDLKTEE